MNRSEFQCDILPRLADLAEAFDRKPLGDAALRVWAETLSSMPVRPAVLALQGWGRSKTKFPAPAEVYAAAVDIDAENREKRLAEERESQHVDLRRMGATPEGREALALVRAAIAAVSGQRKDPKAWARRILDRFADRDPTLPDVSFRFACEALHVSADDVRATRDHAGRNAA